MNLKHLFIAFIALATTACNGGSGKEPKTDSLAKNSDTLKVETESVEAFSTPDLTFAEVTGRVKKITETFEGKEYTLFEFDDNGIIIGGSRLEFVRKLQRNDDGYIAGGDNGYFKVKWEDGKVKETVVNESDGTLLTDIFTYDDNGNLVKKVTKSEGPDGDYITTFDYNYDSDSFDEHGNWVKRNVHCSDTNMKDYLETRKIYY